MTLRTALKASKEEGSSPPQYTGHQIPEDFGESELLNVGSIPATPPRASDNKPASKTKAPIKAAAKTSQAQASSQTANTSRKRKAPAQPNDPAATSKAKRLRSCKADAAVEVQPTARAGESTQRASGSAPENKAARRRGTSCADCRKRKTRCSHGLPAGEASTAKEVHDSIDVASGGNLPAPAVPGRSRKAGAKLGKRVVAAQDVLPDAEIENQRADGANEQAVAELSTMATSASQVPTTESSSSPGIPATTSTPPSSVSAMEDVADVAAMQTVAERQEVSQTDAGHDMSSTASSVLSSVPSTLVDPGPMTARPTVENITVNKEPVTSKGEKNDIASAPIFKESKADIARRGWAKRRQNAAEAAQAAQATKEAAAEDQDKDFASSSSSKESKSAIARSGWERRRQNAYEAAQAAQLTVGGGTKKLPKQDTSARKASISKQTKVVALPLPMAHSPKTKPRTSRKRQSLSTPLPKVTQHDGLLTPESSQSDHQLKEPTSAMEPALVELSKKLTSREPLASKPVAQGQPLVWADSRQALCETVPYFKMPQSGCHQNDRHVYAFLFDSTGHCREYMDSDVIIARAGGGMEADASGQMVQKKHHLMSESQVQAVQNDIDLQNPLVVICGDRNAGAVCKMPHKYNVLGWYKPISVWAEKTLGKGSKTWTTIKYRFERLDDSKPAWHQPADQVITDEDRQLAGDLTRSRRACPDCNHTFVQVYLCGWMCLNPACDQFWRLESGEDAPYGKLLYNPAFLLNRTRWAKEEEPYSVRPAVPTVGNTVGDNLTYINTRGICCPQCGRCSSRRLFKGWRCDNPSCTFENFPQHIPVTPPMLHNPWENSGDGPALARNKHEGSLGVKVAVTHVHGFKVYTYTFDGVKGKFVHAVSNAKINREPRGPDEMFAAMQKQDEPGMDMHLERRRFGIEKMPVNKTEGDQAMPTAPVAPTTPLRRSLPQDAMDPSPLSSLGSTPSSEQFKQAFTRHEADRLGRLAERRDKIASPTKHQSLAAAEPTEQVVEPPSSIVKLPMASVDYVRLDATIVSLKAPEDTFLAGIEEAAEADHQKQDPRDTATVVKPAVEDGDLMTAFSINYGMPYKFIAVGGSLPLTDSPWPVCTCRADLNWASQTFLDPTDHMDFNEELIFAYLEGQKIEYHDDGESGLGPRIATLSLGGKAKMHLRMKTKHYVGCSKQGIFTAEKPMPHSIDGPEMYQKRLAAWNELQQLKATDKPAYERRRKEIPQELKLFGKRTKKADDLVTVTLNHGDIVLMEGYEIQQYLEHKVVPEQCLRFALTCRTVLPDHLKPEERPAYEVEPDDETMGCLRAMATRDGGA